MPVIVVNDDSQFNRELTKAGSKLVVVDFTATWCGPCRMIAPIFEQLSNTYSWGAVFLKVDVDICQETAGNQNVRAMPTFIFYRNSSRLDMVQGADPATLESKINQYIGPKQAASPPPPPRYSKTWYQGSNIGSAIAQAKKENKLFMVFIDDDSEEAKKIAEIVEKNDQLVRELTIPLRLKSNEPNSKHFGQIYPILVVPSIFMINSSGVPVDILVGQLTVELFKEKLNAAFKLHKEAATDAPVSTAGTSKPADSADSVKAQPTPSTESSSGTSESALIGDRVQLANKKLEEIKAKKAAEADAKERNDEMARREMGKAMQAAKKVREDAEIQELAKARDKEKREEAEARKRVLEQIAQDRADRKAREENERRAREAEQKATSQKSQQSTSDSNNARIQFRLPDGSTLSSTFGADQNLIEARNYLVQNSNLRKFTLATVFPKRNLGEEDYSRSFRQLELSPSSVLLVLANASAVDKTVANAGGTLYAFITSLMAPLFALWAWIQGYLGGGATSNSTALGSTASTASSASSGSSPQAGPSGQKARRIPKTNVEREGNVARLRSDDGESEDDNNTWNGNSTQQM